MLIQAVAVFALLFAITHPEILLESMNDPPTERFDTWNVDVGDLSLSGSKIAQNRSLPTVQSVRTVDDWPSSVTSSPNTAILSKMDVMIFTRKRVQSGDAHLALALLIGLLFITAMMVCGVLKGRPLYLLPFFCFQVFDFVLSCLTAAGHYTWLPNLQAIIQEHPEIPFRDQILKLDGQFVALCILVAYLAILIAKAYFVGIVWACYQYLHLRQNSVLTYTTTEDGQRRTDSEMLLPPNYEDALKMPPAYSSMAAAAPPPYIGNSSA